jgi:hypothetical protein
MNSQAHARRLRKDVAFSWILYGIVSQFSEVIDENVVAIINGKLLDLIFEPIY